MCTQLKLLFSHVHCTVNMYILKTKNYSSGKQCCGAGSGPKCIRKAFRIFKHALGISSLHSIRSTHWQYKTFPAVLQLILKYYCIMHSYKKISHTECSIGLIMDMHRAHSWENNMLHGVCAAGFMDMHMSIHRLSPPSPPTVPSSPPRIYVSSTDIHNHYVIK